jgi:hypothetical protein
MAKPPSKQIAMPSVRNQFAVLPGQSFKNNDANNNRVLPLTVILVDGCRNLSRKS